MKRGGLGLLVALSCWSCADAAPKVGALAKVGSGLLVDDRAAALLDRWEQQPDLPLWDDDGKPVCALIAEAYVSLHRKSGLNAAASQDIEAIAGANWFPAGTSVADRDLPCRLSLPVLVRIYADVTTRSRLTLPARDALKNLLWNFVKDRSRLADADPLPAGPGLPDPSPDPWNLVRSENIDAVLKSTYYIALNSLRDAMVGGDNAAMGEGGTTLGQHRLAWRSFWKEYFRQHAREGLNSEYASNGYSKYSLSAYYNVRDFAGSAALAELAEPFLHLYWADVAQDFLPSTGMRGGAKARSDKDAFDLQQDLRPWTYMYTWHDQDSGELAEYPAVVAATSTYRIPEIITAMAAERNKPPYAYASRRPGYLTQVPIQNDVYEVGTHSSGSSLQVRYTYYTADYVFGTLNVRPRHVATGNAAGYQNSGQRWMGAMFASSSDARLAVFGIGTGGAEDLYPKRGYAEIIGTAGVNAMVVTRDPSSEACDGVHVFVADSVWGSGPVIRNGWRFLRVGDAYAAFRVAQGGYELTPSGLPNVGNPRDDGRLLRLEDPWAPIAIQFGQAQNYASFQKFQDDLLARQFSYQGGVLTFVSLAGQTLKIRSGAMYVVSPLHSLTPANYPGPTVNGGADLSPERTYDSRYLQGFRDRSTVTFNYGDYPELLLNFAP